MPEISDDARGRLEPELVLVTRVTLSDARREQLTVRIDMVDTHDHSILWSEDATCKSWAAARKMAPRLCRGFEVALEGGARDVTTWWRDLRPIRA